MVFLPLCSVLSRCAYWLSSPSGSCFAVRLGKTGVPNAPTIFAIGHGPLSVRPRPPLGRRSPDRLLLDCPDILLPMPQADASSSIAGWRRIDRYSLSFVRKHPSCY
jgi:hypothetical protein